MAKPKKLHPYVVSVKGEVGSVPAIGEDEAGLPCKVFEEFAWGVRLEGEVCVAAPNKKAAELKALDFLAGIERSTDPGKPDRCKGGVLALEDESVEFEISGVRRLEVE